MILFQAGQPIKNVITPVKRLIREAADPSLKRVTPADLY